MAYGLLLYWTNPHRGLLTRTNVMTYSYKLVEQLQALFHRLLEVVEWLAI
jgi:hypothetical protein